MGKDFFVHLFHLIIIGSLFLYVGIVRTNIPTFMFPLLLTLGFVVIGYHMWKAWKKSFSGIWVNYIHLFIVGPLLIYIGYKGKEAPRLYFELLLMLGFASIGYHGMYLIQDD
jgi:Na+-transporting methylmalonyl-CoA/oxaloacetate decarboxylase beta subunit